MSASQEHTTAGSGVRSSHPYQTPDVRFLGTVADLTQLIKQVGNADGATFQGIDLGS